MSWQLSLDLPIRHSIWRGGTCSCHH